MKASIFLAVSGAVCVLANPVEQEKRMVKTNWVKETLVVTVTADEPCETSTKAPVKHVYPTHHTTYAPKPTKKVYETKKPEPAAPAKTYKPAPANSLPKPTDYASHAVYYHNIHRSNHSAPPVTYDEELAGYALEMAKACVFAHNLGPGGGGYGQNLAVWGGSDASSSQDQGKIIAQAASDMWYNGEISQYPSANYGQPNPVEGDFENYGHFTQVVWAGSTKVGCASVFCPAGSIFPGMASWLTCCNYSPPGNMGGQYGNNVKPPRGQAPVSV